MLDRLDQANEQDSRGKVLAPYTAPHPKFLKVLDSYRDKGYGWGQNIQGLSDAVSGSMQAILKVEVADITAGSLAGIALSALSTGDISKLVTGGVSLVSNPNFLVLYGRQSLTNDFLRNAQSEYEKAMEIYNAGLINDTNTMIEFLTHLKNADQCAAAAYAMWEDDIEHYAQLGDRGLLGKLEFTGENIGKEFKSAAGGLFKAVGLGFGDQIGKIFDVEALGISNEELLKAIQFALDARNPVGAVKSVYDLYESSPKVQQAMADVGAKYDQAIAAIKNANSTYPPVTLVGHF
jgi:tetratricopeptide (TPR) repeat protein